LNTVSLVFVSPWMPQRLRKREVKATVPVGFYIRNA
jgi:hypothetical protein